MIIVIYSPFLLVAAALLGVALLALFFNTMKNIYPLKDVSPELQLASKIGLGLCTVGVFYVVLLVLLAFMHAGMPFLMQAVFFLVAIAFAVASFGHIKAANNERWRYKSSANSSS